MFCPLIKGTCEPTCVFYVGRQENGSLAAKDECLAAHGLYGLATFIPDDEKEGE